MPKMNEDMHTIKIFGQIGTEVRYADIERQVAEAKGGPLLVLVNSGGGDVLDDGMGIYNLLKSYEGEVVVRVMALAASMASLIAMAGDKVQMVENGTLMIHAPYSSVHSGTCRDLEVSAQLLKRAERVFVDAYSAKTKIAEDEILEMLYPNRWMDALEAKELGFVDEVIKETGDYKLVASILSQRTDIPESTQLRIKASLSNEGGESDSESQNQGSKKQSAEGGAKSDAENEAQPKTKLEASAPGGDVAPDAMASFKFDELTRRKQVRAVFKDWVDEPGVEELQSKCLDDLDVSADSAKGKLLAYLNNANTQSAAGHRTSAHAGNGRLGRDAMIQAMCAQADLECDTKGIEKNPYADRSLMAMAEYNLRDRRESYSGEDEFFNKILAHSSSDFHEALLESCRRAVVAGFGDVKEDFDKWTSSGSVSDFRKVKRLDYSQFSDLMVIPESGEIYQGNIEESGESVHVLEYGRQFNITRKMLVNDDLGALVGIPRAMAQAAKRLIGDLAYSVLLEGHKMADGLPLYHSSRKNIVTASALTMESLDEAMTTMALIRDPVSKQALNINPEYLITSRKLKSRAISLATSDRNPDNLDEQNLVKGDFEPIANARIDAFSDKPPAFLVAGGLQAPINVSYLKNKRQPSIEKTRDWAGRDMQLGVFMDVGVQAVNSKGVLKINLN